jgi:splicing factor 1
VYLLSLGGQIGHRKYDCPEQRNFTANIICRVCGNAGHMARDCPDRQRGTDWRNNKDVPLPPGARPAGRIGDAVDREYESLMQELSGGGSGAGPQQRIEAGPGYDGNGYKDGGSNLPPWQRGATGAPAPWSRPREERESGSAAPWASGGRGGGGGGGDSYGYGNQSGYVPPPPAGDSTAPWQQASQPPPPPGGQNYGYGDYAGYSAAAGYAAPPGMPAYYGSGSVPPPPPGDAPPPVSPLCPYGCLIY